MSENIAILINEHLVEVRKAKRDPARELWANFHQRTADALTRAASREALLVECREVLRGLVQGVEAIPLGEYKGRLTYWDGLQNARDYLARLEAK